MEKKCLIVIDMQNDFISGSLGTAEAAEILPKAVKAAEKFEGEIIFTKDTHGEDYLSTAEGRLLPVKHCIKNTEGWELESSLKEICEKRGCRVFEKGTFGSVKLAEALFAESEPFSEIQLIGLCTDICVVSNALLLKAYMPDVMISVRSDCCAGVTPEKHEAALKVMESCQIIIKEG
ncbi:MAG: cysteine hydrolase [Clostridiales bacterium]|nr:cysteine hydrolase [Clostridiales bacterium]